MELRKFIATTIHEYLNEQKIFENSKLNFKISIGNQPINLLIFGQ